MATPTRSGWSARTPRRRLTRLPPQGVLVNDRAGQEAEPGADGRLRPAAGDHHPRHQRGAGRRAAEDPAAIEDRAQRPLDGRAEVGLGHAGLVPPAEPDAGGLLERPGESGLIGPGPRSGVEQAPPRRRPAWSRARGTRRASRAARPRRSLAVGITTIFAFGPPASRTNSRRTDSGSPPPPQITRAPRRLRRPAPAGRRRRPAAGPGGPPAIRAGPPARPSMRRRARLPARRTIAVPRPGSTPP